MNHKHIIELSSGKKLELTEEEFQELREYFKEVYYIPNLEFHPFEYPIWEKEDYYKNNGL